MPKIRDLGIKVIPETMRPPEAGGGAAQTLCEGCSDALTAGCGFDTCFHLTLACGPDTCFGISCLLSCACTLTCFCSDPATITCPPASFLVPGNPVTPEEIATLKTLLRKQIDILERAEIDLKAARIEAELAGLQTRREQLKK